MGRHEDPKTPKDQPFRPDPGKSTPDGYKESDGKHAARKDKDGKK